MAFATDQEAASGTWLSPRTTAVCLGAIVALGVALRLLPLLANWDATSLFFDPDSWGYHQIAVNLLDGNGYSWEKQAPYTPNAYRPPGLPMILASVYQAGGVCVPHAILLQIVVASLTVVATYWLARQLGLGILSALAAATVLALDPVGIYYGTMVLTEVYTALIVVLTTGLVVRYLQAGRRVDLLLAGLLLGVGVMIHPVLVFLPAGLAVLPLLTARTRNWRGIAWGAAAALVGLLPTAAWVIRNDQVADYRGISCVAAVNLLKYKAAGVLASLNGTTREQERDRLTAECERELPADATPGTRWRVWQRRGSEILCAHPAVYAQVHVRGMALEFVGPDRDLFSRFTYGKAISKPGEPLRDAELHAEVAAHPSAVWETLRCGVLAGQGVELLFIAVGVGALLLTRQWRLLFALSWPVVYVLALSGGPEASPRFRVIYLPFLGMLVAVGLGVAVPWLFQLRGLCLRWVHRAAPRLPGNHAWLPQGNRAEDSGS